MKVYGVRNLVFSSSATVYGDVKNFPEHGLTEDLPTQVLRLIFCLKVRLPIPMAEPNYSLKKFLKMFTLQKKNVQ